MASCQQQANTIGKKRAEIEDARSTAAQRTLDAQNTITDQITKRKELKETKKSLFEAISKEMKGVDAKKLAKVKKMYNRDKYCTFVLDTMTQFIEARENATYAQTNDSHTKNVEEFQQSIRSIKYNALGYQRVQDIMLELSGTEASPSEMIQAVVNDKNVKQYLDFFPFFKTISKICHWAVVSMRDDLAEKKIDEQE